MRVVASAATAPIAPPETAGRDEVAVDRHDDEAGPESTEVATGTMWICGFLFSWHGDPLHSVEGNRNGKGIANRDQEPKDIDSLLATQRNKSSLQIENKLSFASLMRDGSCQDSAIDSSVGQQFFKTCRVEWARADRANSHTLKALACDTPLARKPMWLSTDMFLIPAIKF